MKNLKKLRTEQNLSQKAFGDIFHVSQNTVSQWENGTREPSNETIQRIADHFNVSTDYLFSRTQPSPPSLDEQLSEEQFALWGEVKDLTDEEKTDVLDFIRFKKMQRKNQPDTNE